ncbi:MAG: hypothetical protein M1821_002026 [Bathelium mastoideum]|nr:MAG: hypothetical protein M1821_002026 [Bathelium mastoideum]
MNGKNQDGARLSIPRKEEAMPETALQRTSTGQLSQLWAWGAQHDGTPVSVVQNAWFDQFRVFVLAAFYLNLSDSLNIPQGTASSGTGDIYFQISALTSNSWVALGQGSGMKGANIFVVYANADGNNITLSPRAGTGHVEPQFSSGPQLTLLGGSGVSNGMMTANVKCKAVQGSNCDSWSGGTMDFTSNSGTWIWAAKSGSVLNSDNNNADISQHDDMGSFTFDFTQAKGGSDVNPFTNPSATTASSGDSCPRPTSSSNGAGASSNPTGGFGPFGGNGGSGSPFSPPPGFPTGFPKRDSSDAGSDCSDGFGSAGSGSSGPDRTFLESYERTRSIIIAHGVLASLAFVILFPAGGIVIRVLSFPGLVRLHTAVQLVAYLVFIAAFGLGLWIAVNGRLALNVPSAYRPDEGKAANDINRRATQIDIYHPIIGIILFVLLFFQPLLGIAHHRFFKILGRRTLWSHAHLWLGRIVITLGMINGGLGLRLAANASRGQEAAYGMVAGLVWTVYVASIVIGEVRRERAGRQQNQSEAPAYKEMAGAPERNG